MKFLEDFDFVGDSIAKENRENGMSRLETNSGSVRKSKNTYNRASRDNLEKFQQFAKNFEDVLQQLNCAEIGWEQEKSEGRLKLRKINGLKIEIANVQCRYEELQKHFETIQAENKKLQKRSNLNEEELVKARKIEQQYLKLREREEHLLFEAERLKKLVPHLQDQIEKNKIQHQESQKKYGTLTERFYEVQSKLMSSHQLLKINQKAIENLENRNRVLEKQNHHLEAKIFSFLRSRDSRAVSDHHQEITDLKEQLKNQEAQSKLIQDQVSVLMQEKAALIGKLELAAENLDRLIQSRVAQSSSESEKEIGAGLQKQIDDLIVQNRKLKRRLSFVKNQNSDLSYENQTLGKSVADLSEIKCQYEKQNHTLSEIKFKFEDLKEKDNEKSHQIQKLEKLLREERLERADLDKSNRSLKESVHRLEKSLLEKIAIVKENDIVFKSASVDWSLEKEHFNESMEKLKAEQQQSLKQAGQDKVIWVEKYHSLSLEVTRLQGVADKCKEKQIEWENEKIGLLKTVKQLNDKIGHWEKQRKAESSTVYRRANQYVEKIKEVERREIINRNLNDELVEKIEEQKKIGQKLEKELSAKIAEQDEIKKRLEHELSERVAEQEEIKEQLSQKLSAKIAEREVANEKLQRELSSKIAEQDEIKKRLERELSERVAEQEEIREQLTQKLSAKIAEQDKIKADLIKQMDEKLAEQEKISQQFQTEFAEKMTAHERLQEEQLRQLADRENQMTLRERHIAHYVQMVNHTKAELKNQISKMDQEIQMTLSINPLKEYLKLTEREIDRIDLQLRKTPTLSADRARLESYLDELYDQRLFLKDNIRKIGQEVEKRRGHLMDIFKSSALVSTPPLPPQSPKERL